MENRWESYLIEVVRNPFPGVNKALVIVGSDRRGTAYGLFSISETIGVSPWYWWADAPVAKHTELNLKVDKIISKEPTVKYRGIFINDEDWGLLRWAKNTFEKNVEILVLKRMPRFVNFFAFEGELFVPGNARGFYCI